MDGMITKQICNISHGHQSWANDLAVGKAVNTLILLSKVDDVEERNRIRDDYYKSCQEMGLSIFHAGAHMHKFKDAIGDKFKGKGF